MQNNGLSSDELELSLFGPGYGESLVIHLGSGDWMIVDSCIDADSKKPCALTYLKGIGVDPATQVKLIVATHWHDDHIRGLDEVYAACTSASFIISSALQSQEFAELASAYARRSGVASSGASTISAIFARGIQRAREGHDFGFAINDRVLREVPASRQSKGYRITALSPSDLLCVQAFAAFHNMMPCKGQQKRRLSSPKQNDTAVVLWVEAGKRMLLLGADLEETAVAGGAWSIILGRLGSKKDAEIFKIPHHGSLNGHHPGVWTRMVVSNPYAVLTPYCRHKNPLPTADDIVRLKSFTNKLSITCPIKLSKKNVPARGALNKMILRSTKSFRPVPMATGQIRLTADLDGTRNWKLDHFGTAQSIP